MSIGRVLLLLAGLLIGLLALGLLVSGIVVAVAYATQRDGDGFFTSPEYTLESDGHALLSQDVDIASHPGNWWSSGVARVRFTAESTNGKPVFIAIGPASQVGTYLASVARDEVTDFGDDSGDVEYRSFQGGEPAGPPGAQTFWEVSREGQGEQSITWEVDRGNWTVVLMNADGSAGIAAVAGAGAKVDTVLWVGVGLIIAGVLAGVLAMLLIILAARPRREVRVYETARRVE